MYITAKVTQQRRRRTSSVLSAKSLFLTLMSRVSRNPHFLRYAWFHICSSIHIGTYNCYRKTCKFYTRKYSHSMYNVAPSIITKYLWDAWWVWSDDGSNLNHRVTSFIYQAFTAKRHKFSGCGLPHTGWEACKTWLTYSKYGMVERVWI